jgi:hypothetical protein
METYYVSYSSHALCETGQWGGHDMTNAYVELYQMDGDINWLNIASGYLKFLHDNCKDANGRYPDPVAVFKDCNYGGSWDAGLSIGQYTTANLAFVGVPDKDISSVKVQPGYRVTFYKKDNFSGASLVKSTDQSCLVGDGWNDSISSLVVEAVSPTAIVYKDCGYTGRAVNLPVGDYTLAQLQERGINDNDISSIKVTSGYQVQLFKNSNFGGGNMVITADKWCLVENTWNGSTSSLRIAPSGSGTGDGLTAYYYNGMNFETSVNTRIDNNINFDWGSGSPMTGVNADAFSVRWTGLVQPRYSGTYTFYMNSDNGRRLWINNQLVIDKWIDDWGIEYSGTIALTAGQKYDIKIEYFENYGGAACKLEWASSSQAREVVPQSQLYSSSVKSTETLNVITDIEDGPDYFMIYPNPSADYLNIKRSGPGNIHYTITDIAGQVVLKSVVYGNSAKVDMSSIRSGIYFINVNGKECKKIVKL